MYTVLIPWAEVWYLLFACVVIKLGQNITGGNPEALNTRQHDHTSKFFYPFWVWLSLITHLKLNNLRYIIWFVAEATVYINPFLSYFNFSTFPFQNKHLETDETISCGIDEWITSFYNAIPWVAWSVDKSLIFLFLYFSLFTRGNSIWSPCFYSITEWISLNTSRETTSGIILVCSMVRGDWFLYWWYSYFIIDQRNKRVLMKHILQQQSSYYFHKVDQLIFFFLNTFFFTFSSDVFFLSAGQLDDFSVFWQFEPWIFCQLLAILFLSSCWLFLLLFWVL